MLLEDGIEGGFGTKTGIKSNGKNRQMPDFRVKQPQLDFLDAVTVDEIEEVLLEPVVNHLRQMVCRYGKLVGQFLQSEGAADEGFLRFHIAQQGL